MEIKAILRFLRLRGIHLAFFSYVEKNAFLQLRRFRRFLDPPYLRPFGQLGNIRLKMEEFASQVGGGESPQKKVGGGTYEFSQIYMVESNSKIGCSLTSDINW